MSREILPKISRRSQFLPQLIKMFLFRLRLLALRNFAGFASNFFAN